MNLIEKFSGLLHNLTSDRTLSDEFRYLLTEMEKVTKSGVSRSPTIREAICEFQLAFNAVSYKRRLFFRADREKEMIQLWGRIWKTIDQLSKEPCLTVINVFFRLAAMKPLNGMTMGKVNATDVLGGDIITNYMNPGHRHATAPVVDMRSGNGPAMVASCSSNMTPQTSKSDQISVASTILDPRFKMMSRPKSFQSLPSDTAHSTAACLASSNDPSINSAAWAQPSSEEEFPSVMRSYSVDSGDPAVTTPYAMNFGIMSNSLPPNQSQSPAPTESQQPTSSHPATTNVMSASASATFSGQHYQKNMNTGYRSSAPFHSSRGGGAPQ